MAVAEFRAEELMTRMTVVVRGMKVMSIRLRVAALLFHLAGWVAGCNLRIDLETDDAA